MHNRDIRAGNAKCVRPTPILPHKCVHSAYRQTKSLALSCERTTKHSLITLIFGDGHFCLATTGVRIQPGRAHSCNPDGGALALKRLW